MAETFLNNFLGISKFGRPKSGVFHDANPDWLFTGEVFSGQEYRPSGEMI